MSKPEDLPARIAAALTKQQPSVEVAALKAEVEAAAHAAEIAATEAQFAALDPRKIGPAAVAAWGAYNDATFFRDRLHEARKQVALRLEQVIKHENDARRAKELAEFNALCDDVAAQLDEMEPGIREFAKLMIRVEALEPEAAGRQRSGQACKSILFGGGRSEFYKFLFREGYVMETMVRAARHINAPVHTLVVSTVPNDGAIITKAAKAS